MLDSSEYTVYPAIMKSYFSVTGILGVVQKSWEGEEEYIKLSHSNPILVPCLYHPKSHEGVQGRNLFLIRQKRTARGPYQRHTWLTPSSSSVAHRKDAEGGWRTSPFSGLNHPPTQGAHHWLQSKTFSTLRNKTTFTKAKLPDAFVF